MDIEKEESDLYGKDKYHHNDWKRVWKRGA